VTEPVEHRDERASREPRDDEEIAGDTPLERMSRLAALDDERLVGSRVRHRTHFFIVIVVPFPSAVASSNSSISRFAPGRPMPRLLEVE